MKWNTNRKPNTKLLISFVLQTYERKKNKEIKNFFSYFFVCYTPSFPCKNYKPYIIQAVINIKPQQRMTISLHIDEPVKLV